MRDDLARQARRQCSTNGLRGRGLLGHRYGWRDLRGGGLEILEGQFELGNLLLELLARSAELHALQAQQLDLELLHLELARQQRHLGGIESSLLLDDELG
jgi:hypothetical protein